jgi:hypothetical protein
VSVAALSVERTGVLVIRAWLEADGETRLRARVTRVRDVTRDREISTVAATPAEIRNAVDEWLDNFMQPDR